jgi:hypothetical protein
LRPAASQEPVTDAERVEARFVLLTNLGSDRAALPEVVLHFHSVPELMPDHSVPGVQRQGGVLLADGFRGRALLERGDERVERHP